MTEEESWNTPVQTSTSQAVDAVPAPWPPSGFDGHDDNVHQSMDPQAGKDSTCRNCGQEGHFSRDCTEPRQGGNCFNCGQEGHSKTDCPNPKVFTGACRICEQEGHYATDCPDKVPDKCRNCGLEGHKIAECKEKRALEFNQVADKTVEEAWKDIVQADKERDLDDLREGVQVLQKANRDLTYAKLEMEFRKRAMKTYIIAYEQDISDTFTLMDLDGNTGRQHYIGFFFSEKAPRGSLLASWPENPEENIERLKNAGLPVDTKIPKCSNCEELGHIAKSCKEEKRTRDRLEVKCVICKEVGHRARDCIQERIDRFACRNCKKSGHNSKECPEPRSAENVECKSCNQMGHFSKDCPDREPETCRNCGEEGHRARECEKPRVEKCRNCDEEGHHSRECTKPRDWSRVQCSNCGEKGHGRARCKEPLKEEAQDKNNRPDFIPNTASGVEVGGHDEGSNNKPVTTTDDSNW